MDDMQCAECGSIFHPATQHVCPVRVHQAMERAPQDGKPWRMARAAIAEVRRILAENIADG